MTHNAYKRFVDEMVTVASRDVSSARIRKHGHPVRTNEPDSQLSTEEQRLKQLFLKLNSEERELLAVALQEERVSALHDFASFLQWATSCDDLRMNWGGEEFGASPYNTMHGDLIGRLASDAWEE